MRVEYDPFHLDSRHDPYPVYRELRDRAPVHRAPESGVWCVSRYEDVLAVLKSPEVFSSRAMFTMLLAGGQERPPLTWKTLRFLALVLIRTRLNPFGFVTARNLIAEDGERHSAMRNIVNRGFTPRRIGALEVRAREIVDACLADLRRGKPFDVMEDLAIPLPVALIAQMLGVEPERHRDFKRWSDNLIDAMTGPGRADPFNDAFLDSQVELTRYLGHVAKLRKREPSDDLISVIVAHQDGDASLTTREVVQFVALLLVAGNETTTNLIGNAVTALLDYPAQLGRLIEDPARLPAAIDEALRYDAPIQLVFRVAKREVQIAGTTIPVGGIVVPLIGSANRDERQFTDPDRFDVERDTRGHLAFGFGKHFCLGSSLARLEAQVALEALVPELPRLERCTPERTLVESFMVRGPQRLELRASA